MGTLYDQTARPYWHVDISEVKDKVNEFQELASETGQTIETVIRVAELMEKRRRNNLFVADGDAWDEQIGGIGECLKEIASAISDSIKDNKF